MAGEELEAAGVVGHRRIDRVAAGDAVARGVRDVRFVVVNDRARPAAVIADDQHAAARIDMKKLHQLGEWKNGKIALKRLRFGLLPLAD